MQSALLPHDSTWSPAQPKNRERNVFNSVPQHFEDEPVCVQDVPLPVK
jgi:hypothetical protein